jgi:hypothetical protein
MSLGKGSGTTTVTQNLTPAQQAQIAAQTGFFTGTVAPAYQGAIQGAQDVYNSAAPGVTQAAQNLATTAGQAQSTLGSTGESALRTGISGLENVFNPQYEQNQINAAMAPAEAQYAQNLAAQQNQFGGAGELGSARSALAGQQLAGQLQATQAQTAAGIENQIAQQQLSAGQTLGSLGQAGLGQALSAAGTGVTAAMTPQQLYNQYASVIFGTPASSYGLSSLGAGSTTNTNTGNAGISI